MGSATPQLHIFFFPLMAHGHTIPMIDIARLFALRGAKSTLITTPLNAASHLSESINRDRQSGLDINIQIIRFPSVEAGLPDGCENLDSMTSPEMIGNFFTAINMIQEPLKQLLEEHHPNCIVADMFIPWVTDVAAELGIPSLIFHGTSFFSLCLEDSLKRYAPHENVMSDTETFVVPYLPDQIELTRTQVGDLGVNGPFKEMKEKLAESELKSYGVLANSFYELEPAYADHYRKVMGRKAWHIGPVSLCNKNTVDKAQRGKKSLIDEHFCLNWLDSKKPNSVLYVSFGSLSRFSNVQLMEIAMGLEASGFPFIWVVRKARKEVEEGQWLPEGFEERIEEKGLIIKDWAPQVLILDHPAIGGFVTHCGWNSILEGMSAGIPMITWPLFAEQFYNEKFVTQVLKIAIRVGVDMWNPWIEQLDASVKCEKIEKVVTQLMGSGEEAEEMRRRAKELGEMAKRAVEEGGSSSADLTTLIEGLRVYQPPSV